MLQNLMHFTVTCLSLMHTVDFWLIRSNLVYRWNFIELPVCKKWRKINILMFLWWCGVSSSSWSDWELKSRSFCEKVGVFYTLYNKTVPCWAPSATVFFAAESSVILINKAKKGNKKHGRGSTVLSCDSLKSPIGIWASRWRKPIC